jgi:hypothetical protein
VRNDIDNGIDPQSEEDRSLGNVQELFRHYVETMKTDGKRTWHEVERDLNTNCQSILHLPAKDVLPLHIKKILFALIERGAKVQANRIRSFLHRAFEVGIYYDNDPQNMGSAILFGITANPVAAVPNKMPVRKLSASAICLLMKSKRCGNTTASPFHGCNC